ncbi:hypothetical protein [uncultured Pseudomonas sp.]|uniref:hypothetical protein n=1 Tax=uncultured Pseudomonas sp. TaxID=114707 RepID=UPI002589C1AF|nr:hypothetical protein [uncultured Pseudomonas sp.]
MIQSTFTAELHCHYGRIGVVETPIWVHPTLSLDVDGWLCTEHHLRGTSSFKPIRFEFAFVEKGNNRIYYKIKCVTSWEYKDARLAKNGNGWLGLYGTHVLGRLLDLPHDLFSQSRNKWKIELLQPWDGDVASAEHIDFHLRDLQGHRVSVVPYRHVSNKDSDNLRLWFLNAGDKQGEVLTLQLRNIELKH